MTNQPQSQPPQPQGAPQPAEHQLLQAGASTEHLQQARALGFDAQALLGILTQLLPVILQVIQQARGGQGGGQPTAAAP